MSQAAKDNGRKPFFLFELIYNAFITLCWPFLYFYYAIRARTDGKYLACHRQRLGLDCPGGMLPARRIWIHALSVGETLSVVPLVRTLKLECPEADIVFSSATETGHLMARQRLGASVSSFFFLSHDFPWAMEEVVKHVQPRLFVLVETDIWPNLIRTLKMRRVPSVLVNGRLSERSFARYRRVISLVKPVFRSFDHVFAQSLQDRDRYIALGVPMDRVAAAGNLKVDAALDRPLPARIDAARKSSGIEKGRTVWIGGSTHAGEEEVLLRVHGVLTRRFDDALLILAPRQIHRASRIANLCNESGFSVARRSQGGTAVGRGVYLLDTLGELATFYAMADAAFVGGSLVPFGGHNPLEAIVQEKPTCWGPYLSNFRQVEEDLIRAGCGRVVGSEHDIESVLLEWLGDTRSGARMREAARTFIRSHSGCSETVAHYLAARLTDCKG